MFLRENVLNNINQFIHNHQLKKLPRKTKLWSFDVYYVLNNKLNIEYDNEFLMNNNKYYCSELIYEAFQNDSIFKLRPMTFLHPETKDTLEEWKKYYSEIGVEIPENKLGINPGIMSLSERIEIVYIYGIPDGMAQ